AQGRRLDAARRCQRPRARCCTRCGGEGLDRRGLSVRSGASRQDRRRRGETRGRVTMRSLWRGLLIFLIGGIFGTAFGVALGFFLSPYVFPPPPAAEQLTEADRSRLVAAGSFIHASPSDPIHWGKGKVSVYERTVFLEPDFEVGPGPAFHVYLVPNASVRNEA